jgi:hypothetical protein
MANALYDLAREKFLKGDIHWDSDDIKVYLVDTDVYEVDLELDEFVDPSIWDAGAGSGAAVVATSANLGTKTTAAGVADAADITFSSVTGAVSEALVIWVDTTDRETSSLIAYIDTASGLPVTPNGGDITVQWDNGANKIFKL